MTAATTLSIPKIRNVLYAVVMPFSIAGVMAGASIFDTSVGVEYCSTHDRNRLKKPFDACATTRGPFSRSHRFVQTIAEREPILSNANQEEASWI
jgi:hypothetical protein